MERLVRIFAVCLSVLLLSCPVWAQPEPDVDKRPNLALGMEFKFLSWMAGPNLTVKNVPENLRQVPSHPNDTWIYGSRRVVRTIPFDSLEPGMVNNLSMAFLPEATVWRFRVRVGPNFAYSPSFGGAQKKNEGATREVNQFGKPERGYGTSLVYYSMSGKQSMKPGITSEADLRIGSDYLIIAGYGRNNFRLSSESGYDRWDALEVYESRDLGVYRVEKLYAGFGWQPDSKEGQPVKVSVTAGRTGISGGNGTAKGMDFGRSWFMEMGFSFHANFLKR